MSIMLDELNARIEQLDREGETHRNNAVQYTVSAQDSTDRAIAAEQLANDFREAVALIVTESQEAQQPAAPAQTPEETPVEILEEPDLTE
jgi:hypothetical protein